MKKYFFTGLITLLPIALTLLIIRYLFDLFTDPFLGPIEHFLTLLNLNANQHQILLHLLSRLIVLILLVLFILGLGYLAQKFFVQSLVRLTQAILLKIPFVKTIYRLTKDITKAVFSQENKTFKSTVIMPFPNEKSHVLAFITGDVPPDLKVHVPHADLSVFVPTAPHPISGYLLLVPKDRVTPVDVSIEDTFKYLISCGVILPGEKAPAQTNET